MVEAPTVAGRALGQTSTDGNLSQHSYDACVRLLIVIRVVAVVVAASGFLLAVLIPRGGEPDPDSPVPILVTTQTIESALMSRGTAIVVAGLGGFVLAFLVVLGLHAARVGTATMAESTKASGSRSR